MVSTEIVHSTLEQARLQAALKQKLLCVIVEYAEALAYQVRAMTDAFSAGGITLHELRADGGAATMDLLMQLQATNSRLSVSRSTSLEATARGAATIAGLGVGLWRSLDELNDLWTFERRFEPEDPLFVDLGYAAWRRALEHA